MPARRLAAEADRDVTQSEVLAAAIRYALDHLPKVAALLPGSPRDMGDFKLLRPALRRANGPADVRHLTTPCDITYRSDVIMRHQKREGEMSCTAGNARPACQSAILRATLRLGPEMAGARAMDLSLRGSQEKRGQVRQEAAAESPLRHRALYRERRNVTAARSRNVTSTKTRSSRERTDHAER